MGLAGSRGFHERDPRLHAHLPGLAPDRGGLEQEGVLDGVGLRPARVARLDDGQVPLGQAVARAGRGPDRDGVGPRGGLEEHLGHQALVMSPDQGLDGLAGPGVGAVAPSGVGGGVQGELQAVGVGGGEVDVQPATEVLHLLGPRPPDVLGVGRGVRLRAHGDR